jgi:hypothetical protein
MSDQLEPLRRALKEAMKGLLTKPVSNSINKSKEELVNQVVRVIEGVVDWEWRKKYYEIKKRSALEGAIRMAEEQLIQKTIEDGMRHAKPIIDNFCASLRVIVTDATREAITELLKEELSKDDKDAKT